MRKNRIYWIFYAVLFLVIFLSVKTSSAANTQGISLTPFEQQVTIEPNDTTKSFDLILTNHTKTLQELDLSARDFGSLNDSGGILFEGVNSYSQRYGLASWMTLGTDTVVLNPGESRAIPVSVENRGSLQPGGHYGAVIASVNSLNNQTGNHVVINQQLVSLVLVTKLGGERYDLKLVSVSENGNWIHLPNDVKLHFQNPGNVHVIPRGNVSLINPSGKVIAKGIINDGSAFILPESFRDIYVPLTPVGKNVPIPGIYHIRVDYRYDWIDRYASKSYIVHFIDLKFFAFFIILFTIGFWLFKRHKKTKQKVS